jgi:hypothetical protein
MSNLNSTHYPFEKEGPGEICLSRGMTSDETF